jgi:lysozyme family protein
MPDAVKTVIKPSNFDDALARVLVSEGGYVNNPKDPGGATNKGITQRVYNLYRSRLNLSAQSVQNISDAEVRQIYKEQYWDVAKCDSLPVGISYCVFDGDVNSGVSQSTKWLQRALGVTVDGAIGPNTITAANEAEPDALIDAICDRRLAYLKALSTWKTFGKGWSSRVEHVRGVAKQLANSITAQPAAFFEAGNIKAPPALAKKNMSPGPGDATAGGGAVSVALTQVQDQLSSFTTIKFVGEVVTAITIIGMVAVAFGFAYRFYAKRHNAALADALDITPVAAPIDAEPAQ